MRDACRMIQNKQMTREEGLELARKYDAEFPATYHDEHLEYLSLTEAEFQETINKHRDPQIWENRGNEWILKHPVQ